MNRARKLQPSGFTPALGAYSHGLAVPVGDSELIFVTGQIAMDAGGNVVAPGDAAKQAEFVFENIRRILAEAGAGFADVVKATVFLTDMADFPKFSAVRNRYFQEAKEPRPKGRGVLGYDGTAIAARFTAQSRDSSAARGPQGSRGARPKPVSTLVEVAKLVKPGCVVEIEVIAVRNV